MMVALPVLAVHFLLKQLSVLILVRLCIGNSILEPYLRLIGRRCIASRLCLVESDLLFGFRLRLSLLRLRERRL